MERLDLTSAFKRYGATPKNNRWAVSGVARDGGIVISCWQSALRRVDRALIYRDTLSSWTGTNPNGSNLLREHLEQALAAGLPIHLVVAHAAESSAGSITDHFSTRPEVVGTVASFDGDEYVLEFKRL
jgi:hypothetical protein